MEGPQVDVEMYVFIFLSTLILVDSELQNRVPSPLSKSAKTPTSTSFSTVPAMVTLCVYTWYPAGRPIPSVMLVYCSYILVLERVLARKDTLGLSMVY